MIGTCAFLLGLVVGIVIGAIGWAQPNRSSFDLPLPSRMDAETRSRLKRRDATVLRSVGAEARR